VTLEWLDIDPWVGVRSDSTCPAERTPFLPGTGPLATCMEAREARRYEYGYENLDSLYAPDTSWSTPVPEDSLAPDTTETTPEEDSNVVPSPERSPESPD